jgi:predicted metal-dependent hydrolase
MQKFLSVQCGDTQIPYILRKRRGQKTMALRVRDDAVVTLTVPFFVSHLVAEKYIASMRGWIERALLQVASHASQKTEVRDPADIEAEYERYKESARAHIRTRLVALNYPYGFEWGRVSIRKNTTRWGSCSSKKNLNFDYRILFLPPHLQDYILVHKLCHLREMNHSPRFWALVARAIPEYKECRKALAKVRKEVLERGIPF